MRRVGCKLRYLQDASQTTIISHTLERECKKLNEKNGRKLHHQRTRWKFLRSSSSTASPTSSPPFLCIHLYILKVVTLVQQNWMFSFPGTMKSIIVTFSWGWIAIHIRPLKVRRVDLELAGSSCQAQCELSECRNFRASIIQRSAKRGIF